MAAKQTPDPLVINGKIALGSPLHRLQSAFDDEETGVYAGDLRDVLNACDSKDEVVSKLVKKTADIRKGERFSVGADEVEYLTAMLLAPPVMQVLEPAPVQIVQSRETKASEKAGK